MKTKMNPKVKRAWVAALRSGKYKQGKYFLRRPDNAFCCLGVLCNLHAEAHPHLAARETNPQRYIGQMAFPPREVLNWAGLKRNQLVRIGGVRGTLDSHNDQGRRFQTIAKAIEEQL